MQDIDVLLIFKIIIGHMADGFPESALKTFSNLIKSLIADPKYTSFFLMSHAISYFIYFSYTT